MDNKELEVKEENNWQSKVLIVGTVSGAIVGLAAGYLLVMNTEKKGEKFQISVSEGVRIGLLALTLIRNVARL